jgi:hypothetical protein
MKPDCCSFINASNSSSMYPKELSKYTNDGYKKPISAYSLSLRALVNFLEILLGRGEKDVTREVGGNDVSNFIFSAKSQYKIIERKRKSIDSTIPLLSANILSGLSSHYAFPSGTWIFSRVSNCIGSA